MIDPMAGHITQILKGRGDDRSVASEQLAPLVHNPWVPTQIGPLGLIDLRASQPESLAHVLLLLVPESRAVWAAGPGRVRKPA
jgi:hypothetical protein